MFIDIHTHLDQYDAGEPDEIVQRAAGAGVGAVITAGVTVESSGRCIDLARGNARIFAGVGIHPQDLTGDVEGETLDELRRLASDERVVVMSEIGLDHQPESPDRELQERAFRVQIGVARDLGLPVVYHMREATADSLRVLRDERVWELGGAAHYFQGSWEDASGVMDLGLYISLAKPLLRLPGLQDVARRLPMSSIVLETDCYPQPFKGKREKWTESRDVPLVAAKLAELKGISMEEVERVTTENALRMLGRRAHLVQAVLTASGVASAADPSPKSV